MTDQFEPDAKKTYSNRRYAYNTYNHYKKRIKTTRNEIKVKDYIC